jgi:hypothetical protein
VDGDGRPDTLWIGEGPGADGFVPFGLTTAAGGTFSAPIETTSPDGRSALVADVSGDGDLVALASDGRQVLLYGIGSCALVPLRDAAGRQYSFDLGFDGTGTGVGCVDVDGDGRRDLARLQAVRDLQGGVAAVDRTLVRLDGGTAVDGATTSVPVTGPAEADAASAVGCGELTLAGNGVSADG